MHSTLEQDNTYRETINVSTMMFLYCLYSDDFPCNIYDYIKSDVAKEVFKVFTFF